MTTAEIYKLKTHRTPVLCAAALLVGVLVPSVVLIWYTPSSPTAYSDAFTSTFEVLTVLLAVVFGGWVLGTEYRQGTVKRLLTTEPRRVRVMTTKGLVGAGTMATVLAAAAAIGWSAARAIGSMHGATVPWNGRTLLASGITAVIAGTVAYSLSAITRSDSFAMAGTIALIIVIEPLFSLVPGMGDYTIGGAITSIEQSMTGGQGDPFATLSTPAAVVTLAVWLTAFLTTAVASFARRDV